MFPCCSKKQPSKQVFPEAHLVNENNMDQIQLLPPNAKMINRKPNHNMDASRQEESKNFNQENIQNS
jgi:hypothetical protein